MEACPMRASLRRLSATVALMACLACGGAPAHTDTLRAEFESPDAGSARSAAPEVMAEADRARELMLAAEDAGDAAAAADERTRARLLLEAAGTQAERVSLEQAQREAEAREEAATVEAVRLETLREQEARALAQDLAGDLARDQARQAFAQAEEDETRRSARNAGPVAAARQRAAQALTLRAQLVLAAAEVMGAAPADVDALRASLATESNDPVVALQTADGALSRALTLLGRARAAQPPAAGERASLEAAARDRGFVLEARPEGLVVRAEGIFTHGPRPATVRLNHLLDLLRAHPRGAVAITLSGDGALGRRQQAALQQAFGADPPAGLRFELTPPTSIAPAGTVELLFFAVAAEPPPTP